MDLQPAWIFLKHPIPLDTKTFAQTKMRNYGVRNDSSSMISTAQYPITGTPPDKTEHPAAIKQR
jgi:hypothetical protein